MSFNPDPGVTDAEETNFVARLEDRYQRPDMTPAPKPVVELPDGWRLSSVDPLGYGRWSNSYFIKRQTGQPHEEATQNVLAEIEAIVHPKPQPPFVPASRAWDGNMCGLRIPGLPPVPGGAADASLFLSWFYHLYGPEDRAKARAAYLQKGLTHWLLSWPDAQDAGLSPEQFKAVCAELADHGFSVCVMLSAKPTSSANVRDIHGTLANIMLVLPSLVGLVPMFCVGWELSLWLSPTDLQFLVDQCAPVWLAQPRTLGYVHFQERYMSFPEEGKDNAAYWRLQVGKLHGVLAQKMISQTDAQFRDWINDCLQRMAGGFNMPLDSGFGHPFDFVMLEISAMTQFNGTCSEAEGNRLGRLAINAPAVTGPAGTVRVMGSGNGA